MAEFVYVEFVVLAELDEEFMELFNCVLLLCEVKLSLSWCRFSATICNKPKQTKALIYNWCNF